MQVPHPPAQNDSGASPSPSTAMGESVENPTIGSAPAASPLRDGSRPRGGPVASTPSAPATPTTPLPRRPKGRFFVGCFLLLVCSCVVYLLWDWQWRYRAFGVVQGRVLRISPPWDGNLRTLHVREGDSLRQGDLVVTFGNVLLEQELEATADALRLAQATLESRVSKLRWESQLRGDRNQKALSEYYEMWGKLLDRQSEWRQANDKLRRLESAQRQNALAVSQLELSNARTRASGLRKAVEKVELAVSNLKKRVAVFAQFRDDPSAQLQPETRRIESLQAKLTRIRERLQAGRIRSPVNGRVLKVRRFVGDFAKSSDSVVEIVEDSSLRPVVYVRQRDADLIRKGDHVQVIARPGKRLISCRVQRLGSQFEMAPPSIQRYYRKNEMLLPIVLHAEDGGGDAAFQMGCEIWLPRGAFQSGGGRRMVPVESGPISIPSHRPHPEAQTNESSIEGRRLRDGKQRVRSQRSPQPVRVVDTPTLVRESATRFSSRRGRQHQRPLRSEQGRAILREFGERQERRLATTQGKTP